MGLTDPTARDLALWSALTADPRRLVVALDFDGTLAPIVEDPAQAHIHPEAPELLSELGALIGGVAVVTGRPVRQAMALGSLDDVGARILAVGGRFAVLGQYGNERWNAGDARIVSPRPPSGLASFLREVPAILRDADAADAHVEAKGIAVALHTRRSDDPKAAFERLLNPVANAAERHRLVVEPGRLVIEVRAPGMDKGVAVRQLVTEWDAAAMLFAGDDLGDVEAFASLKALRSEGSLDALVVAAHTGEGPHVLLDMADVAVGGPDGVVALLETLLDALRGQGR